MERNRIRILDETPKRGIEAVLIIQNYSFIIEFAGAELLCRNIGKRFVLSLRRLIQRV